MRSEETIARIRRVNLITVAALKNQEYALRCVRIIEIVFLIEKGLTMLLSEDEEIYFNDDY